MDLETYFRNSDLFKNLSAYYGVRNIVSLNIVSENIIPSLPFLKDYSTFFPEIKYIQSDEYVPNVIDTICNLLLKKSNSKYHNVLLKVTHFTVILKDITLNILFLDFGKLKYLVRLS